jgi:hypothetical protein
MAIKVFCSAADVHGYIEGPPDTFGVSVEYKILNSDFTNYTGTFNYNIPLDWTAVQFYATLYAEILSVCASLEYETPHKADIFGVIPMTLDQVLPDLPTFGT